MDAEILQKELRFFCVMKQLVGYSRHFKQFLTNWKIGVGDHQGEGIFDLLECIEKNIEEVSFLKLVLLMATDIWAIISCILKGSHFECISMFGCTFSLVSKPYKYL